ncbi:MAG: CapA family protein [Actinobacteria bacterium]|nr:CapA family protein [Actinomycetota bacterium]
MRHVRRPPPLPVVFGVALTAVAIATLAAGVTLAHAPRGAFEAATEPEAAPSEDRVPRAPARPAPRVERIDVVASGDLLLHTPILQRAYDLETGRYDLRPMFRPIRPIVSRAALALCHVETPIGAGAPSGYPIFNAPAELARAIRWTGWDACSTASNHSVDKGAEGVATTRRHLARVGVRATGTARTRKESRRILMLRVRGVRIAFLSYTYGTNGLPPPSAWSVNLISRPRVVADARRARRRGAELVLVNFHWGSEYVSAPNHEQRALARFLLRRGVVDAIVGQHAHVVQPIRRIAGRFVVYGEGNLISAQSVACCASETQNGLIAILRVRVVDGDASVERVDYVPVRVRRPDYRVVPVAAALRSLRARGHGLPRRRSYERPSRPPPRRRAAGRRSVQCDVSCPPDRSSARSDRARFERPRATRGRPLRGAYRVVAA